MSQFQKNSKIWSRKVYFADIVKYLPKPTTPLTPSSTATYLFLEEKNVLPIAEITYAKMTDLKK